VKQVFEAHSDSFRGPRNNDRGAVV